MKKIMGLVFIVSYTALLGCGSAKQHHNAGDITPITPPKKNGDTIPVVDETSVKSGKLFTTTVKDLKLQLPINLQDIMTSIDHGDVQTAGTDNFMIVVHSEDHASGASNTKEFEADMQTTWSKCDIDQRLRNLATNFADAGESAGRKSTVKAVNGDRFEGYSYLAVDTKRPTKNIIIGAMNRKTGDCYSTSLAVYGVNDIAEDLFLKKIGFLTDLVENSYGELYTP